LPHVVEGDARSAATLSFLLHGVLHMRRDIPATRVATYGGNEFRN
jgi:hypothetical protein